MISSRPVQILFQHQIKSYLKAFEHDNLDGFKTKPRIYLMVEISFVVFD